MTTTIIVAGRECRFIDRGGYWRIGDLPWNQPKRINWLCGDGEWHTSLLDSPDPNQWPTEAAAREFASSLAARSQPAEVARMLTLEWLDATLPWTKAVGEPPFYAETRVSRGRFGELKWFLYPDHRSLTVWLNGRIIEGDTGDILRIAVAIGIEPLPTPSVPQEPDRT